MSAIVLISVLAVGSWVIDAGWRDPDDLQFLGPIVMTAYSLVVLTLLAAVVLLTRRARASSPTAERWVNLAVVLLGIAGAAIWSWALIDQVRYLIVTG